MLYHATLPTLKSHDPQQDTGNAKVDPTEGMEPAERIHWQILHRRKEGIEPLVDEVIIGRATEQRNSYAAMQR